MTHTGSFEYSYTLSSKFTLPNPFCYVLGTVQSCWYTPLLNITLPGAPQGGAHNVKDLYDDDTIAFVFTYSLFPPISPQSTPRFTVCTPSTPIFNLMGCVCSVTYTYVIFSPSDGTSFLLALNLPNYGVTLHHWAAKIRATTP